MTALLEALAHCEAAEAELAAGKYRELVADTASGRETDVEVAKAIMAAAGITLQQFRSDVANRKSRQRLVDQFATLPDAEREQRDRTEEIAAEVSRFEELHRQHVAKVYQLRVAADAATEAVRLARDAERQLIAGATNRRLLAERDKLLATADRLSHQCREAITARQTAQRSLGNAQVEYRSSPTTRQADYVQRLAQTVRDKEAERVALSAPEDVPGSMLHARAAVERFEREYLTSVDA